MTLVVEVPGEEVERPGVSPVAERAQHVGRRRTQAHQAVHRGQERRVSRLKDGAQRGVGDHVAVAGHRQPLRDHGPAAGAVGPHQRAQGRRPDGLVARAEIRREEHGRLGAAAGGAVRGEMPANREPEGGEGRAGAPP